MTTPSTKAAGYPNLPLLVGREREVAQLQGCVARAESGIGSLGLVSGEAGIGKSSLVQVIEDRARESGFMILSGASYDLSAAPPYGPWLELIRGYRPDGDLPTIPDFLTDQKSLARLSTQERLYAEVLGFFESIAAVQRLMLVLEDLHWADQASLELLRVIARHCHQHKLVVVATFRDDEVSRHHPLYSLLLPIVRESNPLRIELRPLDGRDLHALVEHVSDVDPDHREKIVDYLLTWAEGNPLYTVELLRSLDEGRIFEGHGDWHTGALSNPTVPQLIRQMVDRRLTGMPDHIITELQQASVIGQIVPVRLWEQVSTSVQLADALVAGIASGLANETPDGQSIAFRHALIREAIYAGIGVIGRRQMHGRVADSLIEDPAADPDTVAYHLQKAGDPRAAEWLIRAGEQAERRFAWPAAFERHQAAVDLLEHIPGNESTLAGLLLKLGRLLRFSDPAGGIPLLQRSRDAALQCEDKVLSGLALFNAGNQRCMIDAPEMGLSQIRDGIAEVLNSRAVTSNSRRWSQTLVQGRGEGRIDPVLSSIGTYVAQLSFAGRYRDAIQLSEQHLGHDLENASDSIHMREILNDTASFVDGYWGMGTSYTALGDVYRGRNAFNLARQALLEFDYLAHRLSVTSSYLTMHHFVFRTLDQDERRTLTEEIDESTRISSGSIGTRNAFWGYERLLYFEGRWDELQQIIQEHEPPTLAVFRNSAYAVRALLAWHQGRFDEARTLIGSTLPDHDQARTQDQMLFVPREPSRIAAWFAIENGDADLARKLLTDHDHWIEQSGSIIGRAESSLLWARMYLLEDKLDDANRVALHSLDLAWEPEQPLAQIDIFRFLGVLALRYADHNAAFNWLQRSLDLANSAGFPFEQAQTMLVIAEVQTELHNSSDARESLSRVRQIGSALDAQPLLSHAERISARIGKPNPEARFGLSSREIEVLGYLVEGMTDRQIAERLFISPNTVMRHVANIRNKLDVDSRTAAVTRATREGLV